MPHPSASPAEHPAPALTVAFCGDQRRTRSGWTDHRVPAWVVDLLVHGSQMQRVGHAPAFRRHAGLIALYAPHVPYYEYSDPQHPTIDAFAVFTASGSDDTILRTLVGPAGYCHIEDHDGRLHDTIQRLGHSYATRSPGQDRLLRGRLCELIGLLADTREHGPQRRYLASPAASQDTLTARVHAYLHTHLSTPITVAELAAAMGMSESAFAHAYPQQAHETPYHAILRSKITAAKRLILSDGLSIQATARRLGFSSPFAFSRAFKRHTGHPPSHLRTPKWE